jgi:hypothetical protein
MRDATQHPEWQGKSRSGKAVLDEKLVPAAAIDIIND